MLSIEESRDDQHCGCGPPAMLIIPPATAILGGLLGSFIGLFPQKVLTPDPDAPYESAKKSMARFTISEQLDQLNLNN